jgi:preprotein translocase SecF subunit
MEVSLAVIAAILTIVGYSLNDTIVVFDRIRENMHTRRRDNYEKMVNASINETISRTIITSLTTLLVVLALVIFGGEVIKDFAVTLVIGVIIGTYSSIFIASPVVVEWHLWRAARARK